jgi:hypothetical protein
MTNDFLKCSEINTKIEEGIRNSIQYILEPPPPQDEIDFSTVSYLDKNRDSFYIHKDDKTLQPKNDNLTMNKELSEMTDRDNEVETAISQANISVILDIEPSRNELQPLILKSNDNLMVMDIEPSTIESKTAILHVNDNPITIDINLSINDDHITADIDSKIDDNPITTDIKPSSNDNHITADINSSITDNPITIDIKPSNSDDLVTSGYSSSEDSFTNTKKNDRKVVDTNVYESSEDSFEMN